MRVYFTSARRAALRLNGQYSGTCDGFERYAEIPREGVFAELVPAGDYFPLNFFTDENFFENPPENVDIYGIYGGKLVRVRHFEERGGDIRIIAQRLFYGNAFTLFCQGAIYAACEGVRGGVHKLPQDFRPGQFEEVTICGQNFLCARDGRHMALFSADGALCFMNACKSAEFGEELKVSVPVESCADISINCVWRYDGEKLSLAESHAEEGRAPEEHCLHYAFFESVLARGDFSRYLSEELKRKADDIYPYLGGFVDVIVPDDLFFERYGDVRAAGLVYPKGRNTYEVRYFIAEAENGVICNIYPAE